MQLSGDVQGVLRRGQFVQVKPLQNRPEFLRRQDQLLQTVCGLGGENVNRDFLQLKFSAA